MSHLLQDFTDLSLILLSYMSALIMESVYGHKVTSLEDEYIALIDSAMDATTATGPAGGAMVDFFPLRKLGTRICLE